LVLLSLGIGGGASSPYQLSFDAMEHYSAARYREAEAGFRQAVDAWGAAGPRFVRDRAIAVLNLGTVVRIQGRHAEAQALLTEALLDLEKTSGRDSLDAGRAASALAAHYQASGRPAEAENLAGRACRILARDQGASESDRSDAAVVLASVYIEQNRGAAAGELLTELLGRGENRLVLRAYNDLAAIAIRRGDLATAESLLGRALDMASRVLPEVHPLRAAALNNVAQVRRFQERYLEAEQSYREALAIWEKALGPRHPDTARGMLNLAALHHERGREKPAEELYRRAAAIFSEAYGEDHELALIARAELAEVLRAERRYSESKRLSLSALPALETRLGASDPRVVRATENYRRLMLEVGR
jgi:tetratricopeptide (TPR) repeat protein